MMRQQTISSIFIKEVETPNKKKDYSIENIN